MKFLNTKTLLISLLALTHAEINADDIKYHADKMENGAILHAFSWSFNTIRAKLPDIKRAGYSAVQTSPIQTCKVGNGGSKDLGNWYFHYQPINYNIGNYQLGSEDEFRSLCAAAESYGIKIIVDAVLNHMSMDWNAIDPAFQKSEYYHSDRENISNWSDRYQITQRPLLELYDLNTQSPTVQQFVLNFLKRAVADGAYGFRYDAAKHIELPDEPGFGGNFWPVITNNGAGFQYGEIIQDSHSRDDAYSKYIRVTASGYGFTIRDAVANNDFSVSRILNFGSSADASRLVTWVESHDNFCNNECESTWLTNEQVKLAWAALAARNTATPLFFSRPVGSGGSCGNKYPGYSFIGDEGDALYKDPEVAAVNLFRNAMEGESEYLRNGGNSPQILMIERGNRGVVIINLYGYDYYLNNVTNLADGDYQNQTGASNTFQVSGGTIRGLLLARSVTVLYRKSDTGFSDRMAAYFEKPSSWGTVVYAYVYSESSSDVSEMAPWPGKPMTSTDHSFYSVSIDRNYEGGYIIFNDGNQQTPTNSAGFGLGYNGVYNSDGWVRGFTGITIYYYSQWSKVFIHYQADNGSWTAVPGVQMAPIGNGYYKYSLEASSLNFVFTDGNDWDNNSENNYSVSSSGSYIVNYGSITTGEI